jgi:ligand-binding sensor domain-containing protein
LLVSVFAGDRAALAAAPTTAPSPSVPLAQLAPGQTPGTWHVVYRARVELAMPGKCPLAAKILEQFHEERPGLRMRTAADGSGEFVVEDEVRPGTYQVRLGPADEANADYWPSDWQRVHVDKAGRLYQPRGWLSPAGKFVLERRMKDLSPAQRGIADAPRPVLKWPAIEGAVRYRGWVYSGGGDRMKPFDVEETQYTIGAGVAARERCSWRVMAINAAGKTLARGEAMFFGWGTDAAAVARANAEAAGASTCSPPPEVGRPYLGVVPFPMLVPKDPATPIPFNDSGGLAVEDAGHGFIPGIEVHEVLPGSPAVEAELHPDDVIVAIDGRPVPAESNLGDRRAFIEQILRLGAGHEIALTVRRFPQELTLHATIAGYPGGGAATSQPVTPPALLTTRPATPAAPAEGLAWREVEPGSPAKHALRINPNAELTNFSAGDDLAPQWAQCMAELPHGGMAFGSHDGLNLWDGAEIRVYTGPEFASRRGGTVAGNSGLPANDIQDLLCDSKGRLWVATSYGVCRIDDAPSGAWHVLERPGRGAFDRHGFDLAMDVMKLFEASDGTFVIGGRGSSITLVDPKTDAPKLIHGDGDMNHWITGIAEDRQHRLWFSVRGVGVLRYDGGKVEPVRGPWVLGDDGRGLCIDHLGTIWLSCGSKGLSALRADGSTETFTCEQLGGDYLMSLATDRTNGHVWASCGCGLALQTANDVGGEAKGWRFAEGGGGGYVLSAVRASDGAWWISTPQINRFAKLQLSEVKPREAAIQRAKQEIEKTYPNVKPSRQTAVSPAGIVVTVAGERLLRFDGKQWEDLTARFGQAMIYKVRADSKGTIWIATSGQGLIGLDPGGAVRRYNNEPHHSKCVIYDFDEAPDGTLYVGTQNGVYRLRGQLWEQIPSELFQVGQVLVDRGGLVWLIEITYDRLYVYDGKRFREVKDQTALSDEKLGSLRLDDAGNVLVDVAAQPAEGKLRRTYRWEVSADGKVGEPIEVK